MEGSDSVLTEVNVNYHALQTRRVLVATRVLQTQQHGRRLHHKSEEQL